MRAWVVLVSVELDDPAHFFVGSRVADERRDNAQPSSECCTRPVAKVSLLLSVEAARKAPHTTRGFFAQRPEDVQEPFTG